jgi:hypothetical protein
MSTKTTPPAPTATPLGAELPAENVSRKTPTRQSEGREHDTTERMASPGIDRWSPVAQLETPKADGEFRFRWIREEVNGQRDNRNMTMARREGYVFVRTDEADLLGLIVDDALPDGLARHGGLVLAKIPELFCQQREAHYSRERTESVAAANRIQGVQGGNLPTSYEERGSGPRNVGEGAKEAMQQTKGDW